MSDGVKQTIVGQFFETVAHAVIGGELSRNGDGDICLWKEETTIEVKSSGFKSSYGFRLNIDQITGYEELCRFPFSRAWYAFFAYRNNHNQGKGNGTELAKHQAPIAVNRYLAGAVLWGAIVDLSIVQRWRDTKPISTKSVEGHLGTRTIDIKCKEVYHLANGGFADTLKSLDLDPVRFATISGPAAVWVKPDLLSRYLLKFPLTMVLPQEEIRWTQRLFNRRGYQLKVGRWV